MVLMHTWVVGAESALNQNKEAGKAKRCVLETHDILTQFIPPVRELIIQKCTERVGRLTIIYSEGVQGHCGACCRMTERIEDAAIKITRYIDHSMIYQLESR